MKLLRSTVIAMFLSVACISSASARDSFSLGVNVGNYGYAPPVVYYPAPPVVYYRPAPTVYYQPFVSYRYYDHDRRGYDRGWDHDGWRRERWEHHGWDRDRGDHDAWGHGNHRDDDRR